AILIAIGPQRFVPPPKPPHIATGAPLIGDLVNAFFELLIENEVLPVDCVAENFNPLLGDSAEKLISCVGKEPHAIANKLIGDRLQRDTGAVEFAENALRFGDV